MKHGLSGTPTYMSWWNMRYRCTNPDYPQWKDYGGRGIKVCDRWLDSFENFLEDMGPKPTVKHTIERSNNNGDYDPVNCYWEVDRKKQNRNQRRVKMTMVKAREIRYLWEHTALTMSEIARKFEVNKQVVYQVVRNKTWKGN
jgi:hypothetical protein